MPIPNATFSTEKWLPWRLLHLPYLWYDFLTTDILDNGFLFSVLLSFLSFLDISPEKVLGSEKVRHHLTSSQESQRKFYPDGTVNWWGLGQQTLLLPPHSTNPLSTGCKTAFQIRNLVGATVSQAGFNPPKSWLSLWYHLAHPREPAASVLPI